MNAAKAIELGFADGMIGTATTGDSWSWSGRDTEDVRVNQKSHEKDKIKGMKKVNLFGNEKDSKKVTKIQSMNCQRERS